MSIHNQLWSAITILDISAKLPLGCYSFHTRADFMSLWLTRNVKTQKETLFTLMRRSRWCQIKFSKSSLWFHWHRMNYLNYLSHEFSHCWYHPMGSLIECPTPPAPLPRIRPPGCRWSYVVRKGNHGIYFILKPLKSVCYPTTWYWWSSCWYPHDCDCFFK